MAIEKRKYSRGKRGIRAEFAGDEHSPRVECLVTELSRAGARIVPKTNLKMPKTFLLFLPDRVTRRCITVWQKDREAGIRFRYTLSVDPAKE